MTKDEIIKLAEKLGATIYRTEEGEPYSFATTKPITFEAFAAALAQQATGEPVAWAVLSTHSGDVEEIDLFKKQESAERHRDNNGGVVVGLVSQEVVRAVEGGV